MAIDDALAVPFVLYDAEGDPAPEVLLQVSLGGGEWETVAGEQGPLAADADGESHCLRWEPDAGLDSDEVLVRVVVPYQVPRFVAFPIQHGALGSVAGPFRFGRSSPAGDDDDSAVTDDDDAADDDDDDDSADDDDAAGDDDSSPSEPTLDGRLFFGDCGADVASADPGASALLLLLFVALGAATRRDR